MAIYNELGDKGQLNNILQRRLTISGSAPAPALMPEIGPTLVLENDRPEWKRWKNEVPFSVAATVAAVAGEYGSVIFTPPGATADYVVVIEQITNVSAVDVQVGWGVQPAYGVAGISNAYARDGSSFLLPLNNVAGTTAGLPAFLNGGEAILDRIPQSTTFAYPIILWPGSRGLLIRGVTVNLTVRTVMRGYMRQLTQYELG
jgi:hypothetical protein